MASCLALITLAFSGLCMVGCQKSATQAAGHSHQYTCPMHPEVVKDVAGECPKCGMKLVEKK
ncbi:MAG: hypothetical protein JWN25_2095 [Verrucomicrobiales bacterium]|nr:hypothetical protein [Verrucomicrobiales bacterium]